MRQVSIPQIKLANVVPGAKALDSDDKGVNETFIGLIQSASQQLRAYIKVLDARQLVNELTCVTLGRAIGLPIPEGFIVQVTKEELPESKALIGQESEVLIFASVDAGHPSLKRRLNKASSSGLDLIKDLLENWKDLDTTIIFDEWIANVDRNFGNLIVETSAKIWLIDHGHCLTGENWNAKDLEPKRLVTNKLANLYFPGLTLPRRMEIRSKTNELSKVFSLVDAETALSNSYVDRLLNPKDLSALQKFIQKRAITVIDLIASKLGVPNMEVSNG